MVLVILNAGNDVCIPGTLDILTDLCSASELITKVEAKAEQAAKDKCQDEYVCHIDTCN